MSKKALATATVAPVETVETTAAVTPAAVTELDLTALSLTELKTLRVQVEKAINSFTERARAAALTELTARAAELGFTLGELAASASTKRKSEGTKTVAPKYANPADASQVWTGRGRQPVWFRDALAAGTTAEAMLIVAPAAEPAAEPAAAEA